MSRQGEKKKLYENDSIFDENYRFLLEDLSNCGWRVDLYPIFHTKLLKPMNVTFIFSNDRRVFAKLLYRYELFQKVKHLPGDIVELGVFKGSGIATWCKICDLFIPHTNKKVIGFDIFSSTISSTIFSSYQNGHTMSSVVNRTTLDQRSIQTVKESLAQANISDTKYILIEGDVCVTTKEFIGRNPGFRISLLYLDLDLDEPTYETLQNLWDRVVPGGYIIFDEYE
jgi:hypothetical protein